MLNLRHVPLMRSALLLLPALIPSWRFFDEIAPSPRIDYRYLDASHEVASDWHPFQPPPDHLSLSDMFVRLFWNPQRNVSLYMISCAERVIQQDSTHAMQEITARIRSALTDKGNRPAAMPYLQWRLVFWSRDGEELQQHIAFLSDIYSMTQDERI